MGNELILLPAIDVVDGQAVRLTQGELSEKSVYGDPLEVAMAFAQAGAEWIHFVDLDAAFGRGSNRAMMHRVIGEVGIKVELTGGIRDDVSLREALDSGCARVNLGTVALENPEWTKRCIEEFGDRIAVGLDVRGHTLATRGWTEDAGNLFDALARLDQDGCARYVVTDVSKDGTLQGPNLQLLREVMKVTSRPVVASGGISSLADVIALRALVGEGLEGAIIGKALYSGAFTLQEALQVAGAR